MAEWVCAVALTGLSPYVNCDLLTVSSAQVCWRSSSVEAGAVYKDSVRTARGQSENREELTRGVSMQLKLQYVLVQ